MKLPADYQVLAHSTEGRRDGAVIVDEHGRHVTALWGPPHVLGRSVEEIDRIAHLFAASYKLLDALQAIVGHEAHLLNAHRVEAAREAIRSATLERRP